MTQKRQADYKKALRTARGHLRTLYRQRDEIEREIAALRQSVLTLGALCEEGSDKEVFKHVAFKSLTDAVLHAVVASSKPISTTAIRELLEDVGFEMPSSNPLASINSVLRRLWQQRRISVAYKRGTSGEWKNQPVELTNRFYWYTGENAAEPPREFILIKDWVVRRFAKKGDIAKE